MGERDALLKEVVRQPLSDEPRLAFAEWAERNGESDRAAFIRMQIATGEASNATSRLAIIEEFIREVDHAAVMRTHWIPGKENELSSVSVNSESQVGHWWRRWFGVPFATCHQSGHGFWASVALSYPFPALVTHDPGSFYFWARSGTHTPSPGPGFYGDEVLEPDCYSRWEFRRGFISHIRCHWDHWLEFGDILCEREPIVSVELTSLVETIELFGGDQDKMAREAKREQLTTVRAERLLRRRWPSVHTWILPGLPWIPTIPPVGARWE
jgi:uncharacterized protein (TIGR02996 family)